MKKTVSIIISLAILFISVVPGFALSSAKGISARIIFTSDIHSMLESSERLDGTDITERVEGENSKYRFTLLSSDNPYDINFTLTDIAGNETNLPVDNVLVSTSYVKIVFHRLWQQIVPACAAAGLIIWGITAFVRRKRGN